MFQRLLISALTLALWVPIGANAGTKIINQGTADEQLGDLYIQDGMLATLDDTGNAQFIFDNKMQVVTVLQHGEKRYMQFDQQSLTAMAGDLNQMRDQAMSMMQREMAGLSAEQRQKMEDMMGDMMPAPSPQKPALEAVQTSRKEQVNGVVCRWIEIHQGATKISEACVAKLGDTELDRQDYQTLQGFFTVIEKVVSEFGGADQDMPLNKLMFEQNRVPLKIKDYSPGSRDEYRLKFMPGSFDANLFTVPKDYQLQDLPKMSMPEN